MKKTIFAFFYVFLFCDIFKAMAADSNTYPSFSNETIKIATTSYVSAAADGVSAKIDTLNSNLKSDNATIATTRTNIANLQSDRLDIPTGSNVCPDGQMCGYISVDGTSGTKKWIVVQ